MGELKRKKKKLEKALGSIRINRVILPMIIGLGVVFYLMWHQLDPVAFRKINWDTRAFSWIALGVLFYVIRHLAYSLRLKVLSEGAFSWSKSIELIFIWEFASAVSPTNIGGSAVALVLLAQEKIKAAKTVSIVLYSVVLDTLFFIITLPLLYWILGPRVIRPGLENIKDIDGYGITFLIVFAFMFTYGMLFFIGLFVRPDSIRKFLLFLSRWKILARFRRSLEHTADDIIITSKELRKKNWVFHLKAMLATFTAWFFKFALIFCLIFGLIKEIPITLENMAMIYGRYETMFAITAFSPTPGGSGLAEFLFGGFYTDYVPASISVIIAFLWRLIAYYSYLFIGVIIVPNWIKNVINRRKKKKKIEVV